MRRRDFIALIGGTAAAWPVAARAQQSTSVIGLLSGTTAEGYAQEEASVRKALGKSGYVEGKNLTIEYRRANDDYGRLPSLATDLVRRSVSVIVTVATTLSARAAKAATSTIPIVFVVGNDAVETGLVASLSRPEANVTGTSLGQSALVAKRMEILRDVLPKPTQIAMLINPSNNTAPQSEDGQAAAKAIGLQFLTILASNEQEIEAAFATMVQRRVDGLMLSSDALYNSRVDQIVALAARHSLPVIFNSRHAPENGGLISYSGDRLEAFRQAGLYAARILKGAKPSELPVVLPTKFELVINLKTAKALGLDLPARLLALATDVIE